LNDSIINETKGITKIWFIEFWIICKGRYWESCRISALRHQHEITPQMHQIPNINCWRTYRHTTQYMNPSIYWGNMKSYKLIITHTADLFCVWFLLVQIPVPDGCHTLTSEIHTTQMLVILKCTWCIIKNLYIYIYNILSIHDPYHISQLNYNGQ